MRSHAMWDVIERGAWVVTIVGILPVLAFGLYQVRQIAKEVARRPVLIVGFERLSGKGPNRAFTSKIEVRGVSVPPNTMVEFDVWTMNIGTRSAGHVVWNYSIEASARGRGFHSPAISRGPQSTALGLQYAFLYEN